MYVINHIQHQPLYHKNKMHKDVTCICKMKVRGTELKSTCFPYQNLHEFCVESIRLKLKVIGIHAIACMAQIFFFNVDFPIHDAENSAVILCRISDMLLILCSFCTKAELANRTSISPIESTSG